MLGGYNIAGKGVWFEKVFYLVKHTRVTLIMNAFSLDTWDNEYFMVDANGKNIVKEQFYYAYGQQICGTGYKDRYKLIKTSFNHKSHTLKLKIYSTLNEH